MSGEGRETQVAIVALVALLFLCTSASLADDPFTEHNSIMCRALQDHDAARVAGVLKTPYVFLDKPYPLHDLHYPNCGGKTPLFVAGEYGFPEAIDLLIRAGARAVEGSIQHNAPGYPLTEFQRAAWSMIFNLQPASSRATHDSFVAYVRAYEAVEGKARVRAKFEETNSSGRDFVHWLCTQKPDPAHFGTLWDSCKSFPGAGVLVELGADAAGLSVDEARALCPGWLP